MDRERKTPLEVMNDLYTLAYWMSGSEMSANELVSSTYLNADSDTSTLELFKIFRACYFDAFGFSDPYRYPEEQQGGSLRQRFADLKLSVLLSEICEFTYRDISEITGMSVETLRTRLSWGRKLLVNALLLVHPFERRVQLTGGILS
jgi:hypothetical protein